MPVDAQRENCLAFTNVTVRRGPTRLVEDITLEFPRGSHWAVLGPNGAGKTTLVKMAGTLLYPSEGTVDVLGHRFGRVDTRMLRRHIGYVDPRQRLDDIPVHEAVLSGLTASNGLLERWEPTRAELIRRDELLALVGMEDRADRRWSALSQGERARTLIARALIPSPSLLLLDEPCTGLDLPGREVLLKVTDTLRRETEGLSTIMITHHVEEIAATTTDVLMMRDGRVLAAGPVGEILTSTNLSKLYGMEVHLEQIRGRWFAFGAGEEA